MYDNILNGLFSKKGLISASDKADYLKSLQEDVRNIRRAYNNYPVRFDYTNEKIQAGYLITYVPHYTDLLHYVLTKTGNKIANENIEKLLLIGSGPCPEIIGFLRYLNENASKVIENLKVSIFDIAIDEWKWSRDIVFSEVVPNYPIVKNITRNEGKVDISKIFTYTPNNLNTIVVFQNCLNEISAETHQIFKENANDIVTKLNNGSYLIMIDLYFQQVHELMIAVETDIAAKQNCKVIRSAKESAIEHRTSQINEPIIITENLLIDKFGHPNPNYLLPKRKIKFIYSLIQKT